MYSLNASFKLVCYIYCFRFLRSFQTLFIFSSPALRGTSIPLYRSVYYTFHRFHYIETIMSSNIIFGYNIHHRRPFTSKIESARKSWKHLNPLNIIKWVKSFSYKIQISNFAISIHITVVFFLSVAGVRVCCWRHHQISEWNTTHEHRRRKKNVKNKETFTHIEQCTKLTMP